MKKLMLATLGIIVFGTTQAQLEVVGNAKPTEYLESARMNTIKLAKSDSLYMLIMTHTGNQFDGPAIFWLGSTKAEAKKTLIDMINFCDNAEHKEAIVVNNAGKKAVLLKLKRGGEPCLYFSIPGIAGKSANTKRNELSKFCRALTAYNE